MAFLTDRTVEIFNDYDKSIFVRVEDGLLRTLEGKGSVGIDYFIQVNAEVAVKYEDRLIQEGFIEIRSKSQLPFAAKEPYLTIYTEDGKRPCGERYKIPADMDQWVVTKHAVIKQAKKEKGNIWIDEEGNSLTVTKAEGLLDVHKVNVALKKMDRVLSLSDGGALVSNEKGGKYEALRLDHTAGIMSTLLTTRKEISGFVLIHPDVLVLQTDGTISRIQPDGREKTKYKVNLDWLDDGIAMDKETLLLVNWGSKLSAKGSVFTYSLSDGHEEVKVSNLKNPTSVVRAETNDGSIYVVCEQKAHRINIYNSSWSLQRSIGLQGSANGRLDMPQCAIVTPWHTILVADRDNDRVTEFSMDGRFVRHLLTKEDGVRKPRRLSVLGPYLWLSYRPGLLSKEYNIKRFQILKK